MGNTESEEKITKPQESLIVSVQHKELESIHDCEELRQLKQLPKTVPLRPSTSYPFQSSANTNANPNPASNINRKTSLSENTIGNNKEIRENDIDSNLSHSNLNKNQFLLTPSIIGTTYSNTSSMKSDITKSDDSVHTPFNPNTLRPPKLGAEGLDALYKHLREHFTSLAVKVDCNQVSCTFNIQEMDEELAITRANMIDIDYTTNQLQKTITSMKLFSKQISVLHRQCLDAVERCNTLWKLLPSTPRSLAIFDPTSLKHRPRVIMEGAMIRLGTYLKGSKKRWVILYVDGLMAYYNGCEKTELKGVIDLIHATEVIPSDISHLMITVKKENSSKLSSWHFKCPSPAHVTKWLDAIRSLHFIRARSKLKYCENIPTQFLRDNTYNNFNIANHDHIEPNQQSVFCLLHLFNIQNGAYCYQVEIYSNGNRLNLRWKAYLQQNKNMEIQYTDWNIVRLKFDEINHDCNCDQNINLSIVCSDDIICIKYCENVAKIFLASKNCIQYILITDIIKAINNKSDAENIETELQTIIDIAHNINCVQRIKTIQDIEIIHYGADISVIFICDCIEHCLWCLNLNDETNQNTFIKLINTPSPNGIAMQNEILYITSLQCGIYYIALKDIDFNKAFSSPSFFSPFVAKTLQIFENIVLKEIISMKLPPTDLQAHTCLNNNINNYNMNTSMSLSNVSKSCSPLSNMSNISHMSSCDDRPLTVNNMLFVMDIEYQLYMIRLTDLVLISFGIIENSEKLFYYEKFDNLYITRPQLNKIDCISNIYHEIVSLRSNTNSALFGSTLNTPNSSSINYENDEIKENIINLNASPPQNVNININTQQKQLQKVNTIKPQTSDIDTNISTTTTKLKEGNKHSRRHNKHHREHKKKHLSNADIKALMHNNNNNNNNDNNTTDSMQMDSNKNTKTKNKSKNKSKQTKKICFPKSLYLVYMTDKNENENENSNEEYMQYNNESSDVDMEILVEVDNMLQSYMLSELRQHSKKLLSYIKRNYSFLYLYTSPYDGQSMYRELDTNYESSVPAKNLIQHSSIGPVILVKLKAPTNEQIKKQKERELKIKKRKNKEKKIHKKNQKNNATNTKNNHQIY